MERLHVDDGYSLNVAPSMFRAGISSKFTKQHVENFRDTTLTAASAAKERAERKLARQAEAIEKQQQKLDTQMKKLEAMSQNLHRQQIREAKRLYHRLNLAAFSIQEAYRRHVAYKSQVHTNAAVRIQTLMRGFLARRLCHRLRLHRIECHRLYSSVMIAKCIQKFAARNRRARTRQRRETAASVIQRSVRMAAARLELQKLREEHELTTHQIQAAIVIQSNARSFLTRKIYLDVVYLISRIQAAMRGYVVRRQLWWTYVPNVDAITKFQALVRGFLLRRKLDSLQAQMAQKTSSVDRWDRVRASYCPAFWLSFQGDRRTRRNGVAMPSTGLYNWEQLVAPALKRSYWLPAGASFDKRLPVLPVPKRMEALQHLSLDKDSDEIRPTWTPRKRRHRNVRAVRLKPVNDTTLRSQQQQQQQPSSDKTKDEQLKLKLQHRLKRQKRQQEKARARKRQAENEANEQKLMAREEKALRLQESLRRRRVKETISHQRRMDHRRQELECLAMAREERHLRLHLKLCARKEHQRLDTVSRSTSPARAHHHSPDRPQYPTRPK